MNHWVKLNTGTWIDTEHRANATPHHITTSLDYSGKFWNKLHALYCVERLLVWKCVPVYTYIKFVIYIHREPWCFLFRSVQSYPITTVPSRCVKLLRDSLSLLEDSWFMIDCALLVLSITLRQNTLLGPHRQTGPYPMDCDLKMCRGR